MDFARQSVHSMLALELAGPLPPDEDPRSLAVIDACAELGAQYGWLLGEPGTGAWSEVWYGAAVVTSATQTALAAFCAQLQPALGAALGTPCPLRLAAYALVPHAAYASAPAGGAPVRPPHYQRPARFALTGAASARDHPAAYRFDLTLPGLPRTYGDVGEQLLEAVTRQEGIPFIVASYDEVIATLNLTSRPFPTWDTPAIAAYVEHVEDQFATLVGGYVPARLAADALVLRAAYPRQGPRVGGSGER